MALAEGSGNWPSWSQARLAALRWGWTYCPSHQGGILVAPRPVVEILEASSNAQVASLGRLAHGEDFKALTETVNTCPRVLTTHEVVKRCSLVHERLALPSPSESIGFRPLHRQEAVI